MIKVLLTNRFHKNLKKISKTHHAMFKKKFELFRNNPNDASLRTHQLSGRMKKYFAFSVDYSLRVVFQKVDAKTILFVSLGSHDDVYKD